MILMSKEHLTSEQYTELKPFKDEKSRYDAPFGKQSLEMQHFMAALEVTREELMIDYAIDEFQLKEFLFGTPEKSDEGKFFNIYYDLKNKVEEQKEDSNKKALIKLLNSGKAFEKKIFYKLFRTVLGITQKEFSEIVNMNISTIRSWEQGKSVASGSSQISSRAISPMPPERSLAVRSVSSLTSMVQPSWRTFSSSESSFSNAAARWRAAVEIRRLEMFMGKPLSS